MVYRAETSQSGVVEASGCDIIMMPCHVGIWTAQ